MSAPVMKIGGLRYSRPQKAKSPGEAHRGYDADRDPPVHLRTLYGHILLDDNLNIMPTRIFLPARGATGCFSAGSVAAPPETNLRRHRRPKAGAGTVRLEKLPAIS